MQIENEILVRVSVRNFVEFLLRSGDIDQRRGAFKERDAMAEGSRLHRKIQGKMGVEYKAEVSLKHEIQLEDITLSIEGRADGIITPFEEDSPVVIDEIKCVYKHLRYIKEAEEIHLAQAKCYAYIYALQNDLKEIQTRISYCNIETEEMKYFHETYTIFQLSRWFEELVLEYKKWIDDYAQWRKIRNASIDEVVFPFSYRKGQKELAAMVYQTIEEGKRLYIQAPTGTGKTLMSLYPAIKAVGKARGEKIFYLTAKTITRTVAKDTMVMLGKQGLNYRVLVLTAKEKICFLEEMECNPVTCPYAKGHYDRVNAAVYDIITHETMFDRDKIEEYGKKHQVCPFELGLDISLWADCIICDYNYVFDPNVHLKRFFQEGVKGDYIFLTDEVHNLLERGREMYSAALYKEDFLEVKNVVKSSRRLASRLETCNKHLLELKRECESCQVVESIAGFTMSLLRLQSEIEKFLDNDETMMDKQIVTELYLNVRHFLNMYELASENYLTYTEHTEDGRFKIKLFCVNPAANLKECMDRGRAAILFSATLLPIKYYKSLLTEESDNAVYGISPFDSDRRCVVVATDVSSKYTRRNRNEYEKIASYIKIAATAKQGNYLVFFPSYSFMEQVYEIYVQDFLKGNEKIVMQTSQMTEEEREIFLNEFEETEGTLIGFCVMGGIFSEGIDLRAERLIGSIIVGTGLPGIGNEKELLKAYFDREGMRGFDYAYRFPGMNKVLQAAGRVIRTMEDTGVVLLLDERFATLEYRMMYPREWENVKYCNQQNAAQILEEFWQKNIDF